MRVLIHTPYYPPEVGAPQARLSALAEFLVSRGHEVTVLTAVANYPLGRFYPNEPAFFSSEVRNGVRVIRTFIFPSRSTRIFPRLLSYFSFFFSSLFFGSWFAGKADLVITESPPLFLGPAGYWISLMKRAKWVFNVSDLWPQSAVEMGKLKAGTAGHRICLSLEKFCYQRACAVTAQSTGIIRSIIERFPEVKTFLFSNGVDVEKFAPSPISEKVRRQLGEKDEVVCLYGGLLGMAQGLSRVLDAAELLKEEKQLKFVLLGDGPEKELLKKTAHDRGLHNVLFLDPVSAAEIPDYLNAADIIIVSLKRLLTGAVPSKLYEAMAVAKPVLLIAEGEPAHIVRTNQSGFVVAPGDTLQFKESLLKLLRKPDLRRSMGAAGREAAVSYFNRCKIHEDMESFLREQLCH